MAGCTGHVSVNAPGHTFLNLKMAVLTCGVSLQMPHTTRTRFVAVDALDFFADVDILWQTRWF